MTVRVEKQGKVWTVIHSRPEAKNAVDPESAQALETAFREFDRDEEAAVAVRSMPSPILATKGCRCPGRQWGRRAWFSTSR